MYPSRASAKTFDGFKRTLTYVIQVYIIFILTQHLDYKVKSNRIRQIKVIKAFASKYKIIYSILLTGDFNSTKANGDAMFYLMDNGFYDSAEEDPDSFRY